MTAGQIVALVIGIIAAVTVLALFTRVGITITYFGSFSLKVKVWGLTVYRLPNKKGNGPKRLNKKVDKANKKSAAKPPLSELVGLVGSILDSVSSLFGRLHITRFRVLAVIGREDAAQTAIYCGAVSAATYTALGLIASRSDMRPPQVSIKPDYEHEGEQYTLECKLYVTVIAALMSLIPMVKGFLQNKINQSKEGAQK